MQTVCPAVAAVVEAEAEVPADEEAEELAAVPADVVQVAFTLCIGVPDTDAGQLSLLPTGWWRWCLVDDGGDAYRTKSPKLQTLLEVIEKLRSRYSSSTGPSGLGTLPELG